MKKQIPLFAVAALAFSVNAHAGFVDLFTVAGYVEDNTANSSAVSATQSDAASIIGTFRDIQVNLVTDTLPSSANRVSLDVGSGSLSFSNDNGAGGEGLIQWNGQAGVQDLAAGGAVYGLGLNAYTLGTSFSYTTLALDLTQFDFTIEAYTSATRFTRVHLKTTTLGTETINFSDLENAALCGTSFGPILSVECGSAGTVNMSQLGALQSRLNLNGNQVAVDLQISSITTGVPEPTMLALMGAGFLATAYGKRRKA